MYSQIDANKRKTALLMMLFVVFIFGIGYFLYYFYGALEILILAGIISIGMNLAGFYWGDKLALLTVRAKGPIKKEDNPYVYRLVENLCLTAGLPLPKIYILPDSFPNAFATGRDPAHASIALTEGLIERLENEELEGVIAHELSHIKNYDIRLAMVVIVLLGLIVILSDLFLRIRFYGGMKRSERSGTQSQFLLIIGLVLLFLSPLIAKLIQLAISRRREFLADASGALLTRYPEGLASALEKIAAYKGSMKYASNATAHLYIANPFGSRSLRGLAKLFSTHPPIEERIKVLREMV